VAIDTELNTKDKRINLFERGFKSRCENLSAMVRSKLGLKQDDPLPYKQLAGYLSVDIIELANLQHLGNDSKTYLASDEGNEWSAVTVASPKRVIVVANPSHSEARRSNSIMHELAHVILEHAAGRVYLTGDGFALRDYDDKQEVEADWLAGSLLLPRVALEKLARLHTPKTAALSEYSVSSDLYDFRRRMTAINRQFKGR